MDFYIPANELVLTNKYNGVDLSGYTGGTPKNYKQYHLYEDTLCINFYGLASVFNLTKRFKTNKGYDSSHAARGDNWVEFETYKTAYDYLTNKPEHFSSFNEHDLTLTDYNESGKDVEYAVTGEFLDIGRYVEGVPEVFGQMHEGNMRGRRLKIFVQGGGASSLSREQINHKSKRLLRLVDWLENIGVRVALNVVYSNECGHADILVKDYDEPINIYDIGVATSADFFRRVIFYFKEQSKTIDGSYGYGWHFSSHGKGVIQATFDDNAVLFVRSSDDGIESIDGNFDRLEEAIADKLSNNEFNDFMEV